MKSTELPSDIIRRKMKLLFISLTGSTFQNKNIMLSNKKVTEMNLNEIDFYFRGASSGGMPERNPC